MKELKIKSIKRGNSETVYDLNIKDSHHYILDNGVISHNSMDLFPRPIMSGGCLEAGNKIITDNGIVNIEDINKGDYVQTLSGYERVYDTFEYEKERYEVEFVDGSKFICSDEHRFLMGGNWTENGDWKLVTDLVVGESIPNFQKHTDTR